jgi:hypothetical protein
MDAAERGKHIPELRRTRGLPHDIVTEKSFGFDRAAGRVSVHVLVFNARWHCWEPTGTPLTVKIGEFSKMKKVESGRLWGCTFTAGFLRVFGIPSEHSEQFS